ncbi:hypothetical protein [Psychroserpens sp. NJDZ02]|uniref:hypothetical protein n=1 Tax=Psychroserpens sp. NJDZ02 TaxID=2570561 RepID=UPI0010A89265|nr:hypothetical protein [Psychroserpens sp. NJDZ02]QCE43121.1 hypothetical protein E9099_17410 [Psychroserpens sp. NJDZ02]
MKTKIIAITLLLALQACAQQKTTNTTMEEELLNYYKQIKQPTTPINYNASFYSSGCSFELRVNDDYVYNYYSTGGIGTSFPINPNILKAGKQRFSITLYPPRLTNGDFAKTLPKDASFKLDIKGVVFDDGFVDTVDDGITFELPTKPGINDDGAETMIYADEGQPIAVYTGYFNADVEYDLVGWSESVDLRKEDPDKLLEEALKLYKSAGRAITEGDYQTFFTLTEKKTKEIAQCYYSDSTGMIKNLKPYKKYALYNEKKLQPLDDFSVQFFGNGKMIGLYDNTGSYKGKPSLQMDYNKNDLEYVGYLFLHLHRPKKGAPLEIIR